jgi:hypothetical protein
MIHCIAKQKNLRNEFIAQFILGVRFFITRSQNNSLLCLIISNTGEVYWYNMYFIFLHNVR